MSDQHGAQHHVKYWAIFAFLCICTGVSWLVDEAKKGGHFNSYVLLVFVVLAVASAKALAVMMYFMHLKFEGKWKFVLLAPTIILALGLPLALLPDIGAKYYLSDVPQDREVAHDASHGAGHTAPAHNAH